MPLSFLDFSFLDVLDILLVAFLLYQIYRLVKGTVAINIFIGVAAIFLIWKLVQALQMEVLSIILGNFIGVGVIALVIVFQQEIRRFLLVIGSTNFTSRRIFIKQLRWLRDEHDEDIPFHEISNACADMSRSKTGALIVIEHKSQLGSFIDTGTRIDGALSMPLLLAIFMKNSALHDGAVIISGSTIKAAGCILPVTEKPNVPTRFGLRHRAAMGISEKTDAVVVVVSEETGDLSISAGEKFENKVEPSKLEASLRSFFED
jgi:diadenylate cyclase